MNDDLTIEGADLTDDGKSLHLTLVVHNPATRTRHVYSSFRALRYDAATRTLSIQMSDHGLMELRELRGPADVPPKEAIFIVPQMTQIAPGADAELSLLLPRTISRVDPAQTGGAVLKLETLPIHEATTVQVDVAWGDVPFYADPRRPFQNRQQLVDWTKGVAGVKVQRRPRGSDKSGGSRNHE